MSFYASYPVLGGGSGGTGFTASGTATLVAGTATVSNASIASGSKIFLTILAVGGIPGVISVGTITAGVSFVINSSSVADTSTIAWGFV